MASETSDANVLPWKIQQYCLQNNDNTVGPTNSLIRSRLSKESLQQRLLEITQQTLYYDNQLNDLVEQTACINSEDITRDRLQESWDQLTHESDEIEHVLKHKFGMKGGGRLQICQEEILAAIEMGTQFGSQQQFQTNAPPNHNSNNNHHHSEDTGNSDDITDEDEEVNSDIDSEQDIEFDCDQSIGVIMNHPSLEDVVTAQDPHCQTAQTFQITPKCITETDTLGSAKEIGSDKETIYECVVRRKPLKNDDPPSTTDTTEKPTNNAMDSTDTKQEETPTKVVCETQDASSLVPPRNETRDQKFKRLEKNWSKNRRYIDPFKGDGLLSKLGEFFEKQQEEIKQRKRRKGRYTKKKKKKKKTAPTSPQPLKAEQFCYKLGTVKIHIENEHLDGVKPEDIMPFIPQNRIKRVSDSQFTYHLPVVLEYFKIVTDMGPKAAQRRRKKRRRHKTSAPLEGFKMYYVTDDDKMSKIYLGTIKHCYQSDSILSLLIQLSQNCGALTHRCQIILEQQYVTAQDEDIIEMMNENKTSNAAKTTENKSEKQSENAAVCTNETENDVMDTDGDINMKKAHTQRMATKETDAAEIVCALLEKYPDLTQWLHNKPNYYNAVQSNNAHALGLLNKLSESQTEWETVIEQLIEEINLLRTPQESIQIVSEDVTPTDNGDDMTVATAADKMPEPFTETDTETDSPQPMEEEEEESEGEEYIGSDEFVSGLLIVTVYLSRDVFVKRNILHAIKHIKAFDALLDILQDGDEVVGITECFPLPLNNKLVNKQHVSEFDTGLLYEKLKPKWQDMCVAKPDGMVSILWNYQRKAVQWMLSRERKRDLVPNLLWREMECVYEDINDATQNKQHKLWYHIDEGQFMDTEIPQLLDVRGGILADQMGLGKTVECLALINLNKQTHWALGKPVKSKCIILDEDSEEEEEDQYDRDITMNHTLLVQTAQAEHKEESQESAAVNDDCVEPDTEALEQYEMREELLCESAATLIVTPTNILHQWKNEIVKHSPHLKVYIYLGMKAWKKEMQRLKRKRKHKAKRRLSDMFTDAGGMNVSQPRKRRRLTLHRSESITDDMPLMNEDNAADSDNNKEDTTEPNYRNLGKYDVILTDYNVLKAESDYSNPLKYSFRRKKRHEIPDTPLLQIRWWRLILDEAQQIESKVSKCAQMALKVTSKHKWCVTGTPIGKNGLDDLYGLIKFLDVRPFHTQVAWLRTVAEPYYNGDDRRLFSILKRIMWRQAKHHVAKELNIPPRKEEFIELTFCGVEHEYYKKLHDDFEENLKNEKDHKYQSFVFNTNTYKKKDKSMLTTGGIKQQLEILRQACCHPQISRQTFLNTTNRTNGGIMTMKQIMTKMIEDANDRMTQDERELCRAGTYYSDWLIYRTSHQIFDDANNVDSELELILSAIKVLEEVFKVEQSGIDNIDTEMILSAMEDDSIRCDNFDVGNLPQVEWRRFNTMKHHVLRNKSPNNEDEKMQMMIKDLNEGSLSPRKPLKMRLSVTPPQVVQSQSPQDIDTSSLVAAHSDMMWSGRRKRTRTQNTSLNLKDSDMDTAEDDDEDYIPPPLQRSKKRNKKKRIYDSDTDSDAYDAYHTAVDELPTPPSFVAPVPIANTVKETSTSTKDAGNGGSDNAPILTLPCLNSLPVGPLDLDLNLLTVNNEAQDRPPIDDKFARHPRSSMERLCALKVKDRIAVYMFGEWQPALIIGKALNEVMVRFTHFDGRGADLDQLLPLDPEILSIDNMDYALKCAQMKQIQKRAKHTEHETKDKSNADALDPCSKPSTNHHNKYASRMANDRTKQKVSAYAPKIRISETNEKYYQWKKCEIATSHHLKYLYQRLLGYAKKFHLSARDMDILHQKIAVMEGSLAECVHELQEQSQIKVANCREVIAVYEAQIDQWSIDLNIKEITELVKIRAKLPIKQWQKKHFTKVHRYYNKYIVQKEEMQRKLQYSCFKLRSINLRRRLSDWIPSFPSIWDRINAEFRTKFLRNKFKSKMKVSAQSMRVIKTRHTLSQFLSCSLTNFERRMVDIYRLHRDCADAINHSTIDLTDQVSYYRSKWNDLSDITTLFRVFVQIFEDHKKLSKCLQELKETEEKIAAHCAIVDDFDIQRWTVVGIENHLRDRYTIWKQKALGKSQQLRYLQQKHEILLNAGCRVDQECSICQQRIRDPTLTPCGHLFCEQCILAWLQSVNIRSHTKACPQCRYRMTENEIFYVAEYLTQSNSSYIHSSITSVFNGRLCVDNTINADEMETESTTKQNTKKRKRMNTDHDDNPKAEKSDTEEDEEHNAREDATLAMAGIESGTHIDNIDIVGKGDYGTKIESLVKYIKYLSMHQPDAKSLVYSQFNQLLSIIAALLHENGIDVIHQNSNSTLSRQEKAKRIEKFQTDPTVKVLLLSLRTDSSGLTLIQATHVFLLEPSLNEAIELQAIDRVHRVGQTKPTFVHRYFMKGTVEENILRQRYNKLLNKKNKKNRSKKALKFEDSLLDKGQNTEEMTIEELMKLFGNN